MASTLMISIVERKYSELLPLELRLTEGINQLSHGVLMAITSHRLSLALFAMQSITIKLTVNDHSRFYHGIITTCTAQQQDNRSFLFSLVIKPKLYLLSLDKQSRLFQQTNLSAIIQTLFQNNHIRYQLNCIASPKKIDFCAQHQESSLNFLNRILAHYGVSYYFRSTQYHQELILQDRLIDASTQPLQLELSNNVIKKKEQLFSFHSQHNVVSESMQSHAYRYSTPSHPSRRNTDYVMQHNNLNYFYYPEPEFHKEDASIRNSVLNSHLHARANHYTASSNAPHLQPGNRIKHPVKNIDLVITEITHIYKQHNKMPISTKQQPDTYRNSFTLCESHVQAIDTPNHHKISIPGMQSAFTPSDKQLPSQQNSLKTNLIFPWCAQQTLYAVRLGQANASYRQGQHFMARAHQENLITFINGDASKPLVVAQVYNQQHQAPYQKKHKGVSTIRSQSYSVATGAQQNELTLSDYNPDQSIHITARKALKMTVNNNSNTIIRQNLSQCIAIGNKSCTVKKGRFQLRADSIQLSVGASSIRLDATGVHFHSSKISLAPHADAKTFPAARKNDSHHCPKYENGVQPHGKGTITGGSSDVMFNHQPVARLGDKVQCQHGHTTINASQSIVTVNGKPLAHFGAKSSHNGTITAGSNDIFCG